MLTTFYKRLRGKDTSILEALSTATELEKSIILKKYILRKTFCKFKSTVEDAAW